MESQHVDTANDEDGISLADSEKTVESNMTQIIEKLHQATSSRTCCTPAIGNHDHRGEVVRPHAGEVESDIGGDMNHIHRVSIRLLCCGQSSVTTVIVKTAPDQVLYLKKECGQRLNVDGQKAEIEYKTLVKFDEIQPHSVPNVYVLDRPRKAIIMEDLSTSGFTRLQDILVSGGVGCHLAAIEGATKFIGRVHSETWLDEMKTNEREAFVGNHSNSAMRQLMSELLFDRPFNSTEQSNTINHHLSEEVQQIRGDAVVLCEVAKLKTAFLQQNDCLCHGDLATDNVMVTEGEFRIIDLEFSGVGLRAYDLALFLEMILFRLLCSSHSGQLDRRSSLHVAMTKAMAAYELGVGREKARHPLFVEQTCGLIALELMWMIFGSYNIEEFGGDPEPEKMMLSMAKNLLTEVDTRQSIHWNITQQLSLHKLLHGS